ncbi:uncharacterized protein [Euphorbia lathyris]
MLRIKERLRFKGGFGCCGATWSFRHTGVPGRDDDESQQRQEQQQEEIERRNSDPNRSPGRVDLTNAASGMNLAAALAAERQFREANVGVSVSEGEGEEAGGRGTTPVRVSLMRLLEETETEMEAAESEKGKGGGGEGGNDTVCCVCMVRKKGAAFIPCGHTYCRVCSREVWVNRGNCPLCNRSIIEILDIF